MSATDVKRILEEVLNNRRELKSAIEASEARLLLLFEESKNRIKKLEKENEDLKNKLEKADRQGRKNNLVIFGLHDIGEITVPSVCEELNKLLEVNLSQQDFSDVYRLGFTKKSPLKIDLISYQVKKRILENRYKLKGKKIFVTHDLTNKQQEEGKLLRTYLQRARQSTDKRCYIKANKLFVDQTSYSIDELVSEEDDEQPQHTTTSAPPTPNIPTSKKAVDITQEETEVFGEKGDQSSLNAQLELEEDKKNYTLLTPTSTAAVNSIPQKHNILLRVRTRSNK